MILMWWGPPAAETIPFSVDGVNYEVEACEKHG